MASINRKPNVRTHEGGRATRRTPKQELFVLCAGFLNEDSFYETSGRTRIRLGQLATQVCDDAEWCLNLVTWLRGDGGLRTAAQLAAIAIVHARLAKHQSGANRRIITASIRRADEGPALLNAWKTGYGTIPKPVKRGVADGLTNLTENAYLKWAGKTGKGMITIADAIRLTHPKPRDERQSALFSLSTGNHDGEDRKALLLALPVISARERFNSMSVEQKIRELTGEHGTELIKTARLTHETVFSALGELDPDTASAIWEQLIPGMGYQAVLMNLRRIITTCGEQSHATGMALERVSHPDEAGYAPMPISFLSAWRNTPDIAHPALEQAARLTLRRVPALDGRTLIMLDRSGSMNYPLSERSTLTRFDAAAVFACALGLRNPGGMIVPFGWDAMEPVRVEGENPLAMIGRLGNPYGGTRVGASVQQAFRKGSYDRVMVITDEQTSYGDTTDLSRAVPDGTPLYVWNLGGYQASLSLGDRNRVNLAGLTDSAFALIEFNETGAWPWDIR